MDNNNGINSGDANNNFNGFNNDGNNIGNSNNEIGLYDKVTKQFFTNQGTGTFIGG